MKKLLCLFVFFFINFSFVSAKNIVDSYDYDIYLNKNGDVNIKLVIDAYLNEGSDFSYSFIVPNGSDLSDFSIRDDNDNIYDYNLSNDNNITDISFKILSYGRKKLILNYVFSNAVFNTNDNRQGLYCNLVLANEKNKPSNIKINIHSDNDFDDNYRIWNYGTSLDSDSVDKSIIIESSKIINERDYVSFVVLFMDNFFASSNNVNKSWNQILYDIQMESNSFVNLGSNKEENNNYNYIYGIIFSIVIGLYFVLSYKNKYLVNKNHM